MNPPNTATPTVLIVSDDAGLTAEIGGWLEARGSQVLGCPGPRSSGDPCLGLRTGGCPLAAVADVTIVDLHPAGGALTDVTARTQLAAFYQRQGRSVITLVDGGNWLSQQGLTGALTLNRFVGRAELLDTFGEMLPPRRAATSDA